MLESHIEKYGEKSVATLLPADLHIQDRGVNSVLRHLNWIGASTYPELAAKSRRQLAHQTPYHNRPKKLYFLLHEAAVARTLLDMEEQGRLLHTDEFPELLIGTEMELFNFLNDSDGRDDKAAAFFDFRELERAKNQRDNADSFLSGDLDDESRKFYEEEFMNGTAGVKGSTMSIEREIRRNPAYGGFLDRLEGICQSIIDEYSEERKDVEYEDYFEKLDQFAEWLESKGTPNQ